MKRAAAIGFVLLCAGWYWHANIRTVLPNPSPSDLRWYYLAAQRVVHGESPFLTTGYIYPPLLAFLLVPLTLCDYLTARWIWFVFSHACLLAGAWLMWRRMGRDLASACVIALVWSAGGAAQETLGQGQPNPQLMLLVALAYTPGAVVAGAAIGAGFALKLIPGILGAVPALARRWRELAATLLAAALLTIMPWIVVAAWFSGPSRPIHEDFLAGTPAILSWSLPSVALRIADPPLGGTLPYNWTHGHDLHILRMPASHRVLSAAVMAVVLAAGLSALVIVARGRLSAKQVPLAAAALMVLGLLAASISWTHYQVMNYPGVAYFLWHAMRLRLWKLFGGALACAACLYPLPVAVLRVLYAAHGGAWPTSAPIMYFWTSLAPAAAVVLFILMLRELKHGY